MVTNTKIAIVVNSLAAGGAERVAANLMHEFCKEFDVHLIMLYQDIKYDLPPNVTIHYLRRENLSYPGFIFGLPKLAKDLSSYLVNNGIQHCLSFMERSNFIACKALKYGYKGNVHISIQSALSQWYVKGTILGFVGRYLISKYYNLAKSVISCSKWITHEMQFDFGVVKPAHHTIYNPIRIASLHANSGQAVAKEKDKFVFIKVAQLRPQKNHELLLEAFAQLNNPTAELWLLGKGHRLKELQELAAQLKIDKQVKFMGQVSNPADYLASANCFVLSSDFEGLPNVLLEALVYHLPIVSTDCNSGPREILGSSTPYDKRIKDHIEILDWGILTPVGNSQLLAQAMNYVISESSKFQIPDDATAKFDITLIYNQFLQTLNLKSYNNNVTNV
jgi:N-acetylgalactosamine-N,N'-diacetylbacillosaminyl-diphospho-undecaprenol 4-alpha-N-acetylgalactosaminyltransferase